MIIEIDIKAAAKELPVRQAFYMTGAYEALDMGGSRFPCESLDAPFALPAGFSSRAGAGDVAFRDGAFK